jgi:choice-of-anchor A domain-containing protein
MIQNVLYSFVTILLLTFASAKECGKGYGSCPNNQCCSKYGYCGKSEEYCGSGCQSEFGRCGGDVIVDNAIVVDQSNTKDRNEIIDSAEVIEVKKSTRINTTKKRSSSTTSKKRTTTTTKKRTTTTSKKRTTTTSKKRTTTTSKKRTTTTSKKRTTTTTKKRTTTTTKKRTTSTTSKRRISSTTSKRSTTSTTSKRRTTSTTKKRRTTSTTKKRRTSSTIEKSSSSIKRTLSTIKSTLSSTKKRTLTIKRKTIIVTKKRKSSNSSKVVPITSSKKHKSATSIIAITTTTTTKNIPTTKQLPTTAVDAVSTPSNIEDISTSIVSTTSKAVPTATSEEDSSSTTIASNTTSETIEEEENPLEEENETTTTITTKSSTSDSVPTHGHSHEHSHNHSHNHSHDQFHGYPNGCSFKTIAHLFNAFFFGDFTGFNSDIQGRLAAKGTVDISGGFHNGAFNFDPFTHNKLIAHYHKDDKTKENIPYTIVAGDVLFHDNGEILNGGVAYQNKVKLPSYIKEALERQNYPIKKSSFIDFEKEKQSIIAHSKELGAMKENTKAREENGKLIIDLVPGQKMYVIKITDLSKYWDIQVHENNVDLEGVTMIFNLVSDNVVFTNFDISGLKKYASRILWNASNASKVKIQNFRVQGSLLAPNADIEGNNGNIQGQIIGKSFKGNLQIDWVPFNGFN